MLKKNRGYSLIEIGVGILILTVFLLFSIGMFSGCYNNYRRIKARNLAMDRGIYHLEKILQTSSDELTGFFIRNSRNALIPNPFFEAYILDNFSEFKSEYAKYLDTSEDLVEVPLAGSEDLFGFISEKKELLINAYIRNEVSREADNDQLANGTYGFLDKNGKVDNLVQTLVNEQTFTEEESQNYINSNHGGVKLVSSITRIPATNGRAFGNNVLIVKVDIYYTKEFKRNMKDSDMELITLETVKVE